MGVVRRVEIESIPVGGLCGEHGIEDCGDESYKQECWRWSLTKPRLTAKKTW